MDAAMQEVRRRRIFAGIAMIAAPLLIGVASLMGPATSDDTSETVAALAGNSDTVYVATIVYLAGLVLLVAVVMALVHLLREKQPWLGQIGGLLGVTGIVLVASLSGVFATVTAVAELDATTGAAVLDGLDSNPVVTVGFVGSFALGIGLLTFAVGLLRARTAPTWTAWLLAVGAVLQLVGDLAAIDTVALAGVAALLLGLAPLGYELIAEPDEAWIHPTPFDGFRPVVGA